LQFLLFLVISGSCAFLRAQAQSWPEAKANAWYQQQPWLVGSNFTPADAINQLEMWQDGTFDPQEIDKELGWAEGLGMNTMRVFLHDLLWQQDAEGSRKESVFFWKLLPGTIFGPSSSCLIPVGIPFRNRACSIRPFPAYITLAGCRALERRPCRILRSTRACRPM
jgi:hypothetical protein